MALSFTEIHLLAHPCSQIVLGPDVALKDFQGSIGGVYRETAWPSRRIGTVLFQIGWLAIDCCSVSLHTHSFGKPTVVDFTLRQAWGIHCECCHINLASCSSSSDPSNRLLLVRGKARPFRDLVIRHLARHGWAIWQQVYVLCSSPERLGSDLRLCHERRRLRM